MQYKLPSITLVMFASLSLVAAIAIIPIYHEVSAKECNNSNDDGSSCSDKQSSDSNSNGDDHNSKHSNSNDHGGSSGKQQQKDKTPFVLSTPVPFP